MLNFIPARARQIIYGVLSLAALVITLWQGIGGDWKVALPALVVALSHALAAGNTDTSGDE